MADPAPHTPWEEAGIAKATYHRHLREAERAANIRRTAPPAPLTKRQIEQWTELKNIIFNNGGAVVSPPGQMRIRFNCEADSGIPDYLRAKGHSVVPAGTAEVLRPVTEAGTGIQMVRPNVVYVFELEIETP